MSKTGSSASTGPVAASSANKQRVKEGAGLLTSAALKRLDEDLPWYRTLPKEDRAWVGLVAQSGISGFIDWYTNPAAGIKSAGTVISRCDPAFQPWAGPEPDRCWLWSAPPVPSWTT